MSTITGGRTLSNGQPDCTDTLNTSLVACAGGNLNLGFTGGSNLYNLLGISNPTTTSQSNNGFVNTIESNSFLIGSMVGLAPLILGLAFNPELWIPLAIGFLAWEVLNYFFSSKIVTPLINAIENIPTIIKDLLNGTLTSEDINDLLWIIGLVLFIIIMILIFKKKNKKIKK